jgi:hypothetical protein
MRPWRTLRPARGSAWEGSWGRRSEDGAWGSKWTCRRVRSGEAEVRRGGGDVGGRHSPGGCLPALFVASTPRLGFSARNSRSRSAALGANARSMRVTRRSGLRGKRWMPATATPDVVRRSPAAVAREESGRVFAGRANTGTPSASPALPRLESGTGLGDCWRVRPCEGGERASACFRALARAVSVQNPFDAEPTQCPGLSRPSHFQT